jgi:hypothetical protein
MMIHTQIAVNPIVITVESVNHEYTHVVSEKEIGAVCDETVKSCLKFKGRTWLKEVDAL